MSRAYEKVHTMPGYYDGPREGIADFEGRPHLYESEWNDLQTEEDSIYQLSPIDDGYLRTRAGGLGDLAALGTGAVFGRDDGRNAPGATG